MSQQDGGAAFPMVTIIAPQSGHFASTPEPESGMTLRDYFAAKAMQGQVANFGLQYGPIDTASQAYELADAMLQARDQEPS